MKKRIWHSEEARQQFLFATYLKVFETEWKLFLAEYIRKAGFDPNQPRVPAGSPDGKKWKNLLNTLMAFRFYYNIICSEVLMFGLIKFIIFMVGLVVILHYIGVYFPSLNIPF